MTDLIRACLQQAALSKKAGALLIQGLKISLSEWQMMGELFASQESVTLSDVARRIGVSRQAVQRLADKMNSSGLVRLKENPADLRSVKMELTTKGLLAYRASLEKEWPFTNQMAANFELRELRNATKVIAKLNQRFEQVLRDSRSSDDKSFG